MARVTHRVLSRANLALRGFMEAGIVAAFAYWGYRAGTGSAERIALAIGVPAIAFGFWALVDFRRAGRLAEPLRLVEELAISCLAGLALHDAGQAASGIVLVLVSIVHHAVVHWLGERLLQ